MPAHLPGDSPQIKLINEWNRGFTELNLDILEKYLHKDFRKFTFPRSIGQPEINKEEWLKHGAKIFNTVTGIEKILHSFIETPGKVVIHSTIVAKNSHGADLIRESNFVVYITTDDDGSLKVKQLDEFTDPNAFAKLAEAANISQ